MRGVVELHKTSDVVRLLNFSSRKSKLASIAYHDIFDCPLNLQELQKWTAGKKTQNYFKKSINLSIKLGHLALKGRESTVLKRLMRKNISIYKMRIADKAAAILSFVPMVKMVGVTGALAMENTDDDSDVDLIIVTSKGLMWTTRVCTLVLLRLLRFPVRRQGNRQQKDKLCLNIWLDESDLSWDKNKRNIYTAHEIAQILPLVNKGKTYEEFICKNRWIKDYWPNAVMISNKQQTTSNKSNRFVDFIVRQIDEVAFNLQYFYMRRKITNETVRPTRALFHPLDWSEIVLPRLAGSNVE